MARVEWTRIEPGDIEQVIAILLCRENPAAVRVRPSRGDGGIDILVPLDGAATVAVYQVKSFKFNLTRGQKAQAERSFRRLMDYAAVRGLRVAERYLTMPLNPTNEKPGMAGGLHHRARPAGPVAGPGLPGGTRRRLPVCHRLLPARRQGPPAGGPRITHRRAQDRHADRSPEPVSARRQGALEFGMEVSADPRSAARCVLNEHDPHYAYDYSVETVRPEIPDQTGLVAAVQESDGKRWVTIKVLARCARVAGRAAGAAQHPLITAEPGSDLERDLEAFDKYGTPFTAPAGTTDAEITLPGGLGGTVTGGSVLIEAPAGPPEAEYDIRLQVTDPSGEVIAETLMHMQPPTTGPSGTGKRAHGTEQHGAFSFEMLVDYDAQTVSHTVHLGDLTGKPPGLALPGVRLVREFRHPNGLRFAAPYGPVTHPSDSLPEGAESIEGIGVIADIIEALAVIQERTTIQLTVPDFTKLTMLEARSILHAADLIRGAAVTVPWEGITIHVHPGTATPGDIFQALVYRELTLAVGGVQASLGHEQIHLPAARVDPGSVTRHGDHDDIRIVPVGETPAVIRYRAA